MCPQNSQHCCSINSGQRAVQICASIFRALRLAAALSIAPAALWACTPIDPAHVVVDIPITIYSDGSFKDASDDDSVTFLRSNPVRDIGGGRTGQVIETNGGSCGLFQALLLVDCTTGQAIMINGVRPATQPADGPELFESTRALQPPEGPLALTAATTVPEVAALAAAQGWRVQADVPDMIAAMSAQNRYNPLMGCKIYYPDLPGASQ